jgi:hypothetical protein
VFNFTLSSIHSEIPNLATYLATYPLTNDNVYVYLNGVKLSTFSYQVNGLSVSIYTNVVSLKKGDAIAIEVFAPKVAGTSQTLDFYGQPHYTYQYRTVGSNLYLTPEAGGTTVLTIPSATLKIITYTDSDGMLVQTQKFVGSSNRRYSLNRAILDNNYVFVTVLKYINSNLISYPLVNGIDFVVLDDNVTVQLSDSWNLTNDNIVEIISFSSQQFSGTVLGYRIFNDMLGNTSFTRLSKKYSTFLTQPLSVTDTEIQVADSSVLTLPIADENVPGVILINRERIEFFQINGNTLRQLRRGTLGTSPSTYLDVGTIVIDQGSEQTIPFVETTKIQNTFTNTLTNVHVINKNALLRTYPNTSTYVQCDGIALSTGTSLIDQIEVFYGGRLLRKTADYVHDTTVSYDSINLASIVGSTATIQQLPAVANIGDSYLITNLNQVWTYTGFRTQTTATMTYVYSGLQYLPQEYTVSINSSTQLLTLNTATLGVVPNLQVTIVQKDFLVATSWNTIDPTNSNMTLSLLDSTTTVATFLKDAPAVLPDNYFYGLQ